MTLYAFPRPLPNVAVPPDEALAIWERHSGMTLRDYFAAKAMQGFLSNASEFSSGEQLATDAYALADEMLKERDA